jgi:biopolymer transport protein ExbD
MIFERPDEPDEAPVHLTAIVDTVFILLSFFVLTATFGHERDVAVGMEPASQAGAVAASADLPRQIVVRLNADAADGRVHISVGDHALSDFASITAKLSEIDLPAVPVVIAADERLGIEHVVRAMDAVLASPMRRLSLAGIQKGEGEP